MAPNEASGGLHAALSALVRFVLPSISEEQLHEIMSLRLSVPDEYENLLASEMVSEGVHSAGQSDLQEERQQAKKQRDAQADYAKACIAARKDGLPKAAKRSRTTRTPFPEEELQRCCTEASSTLLAALH